MPSSTKPGEIGHSAPPAESISRSPRILAADDQQHILEAIELLLKPQGYEVDVVRSPELAREALASSSYDAVLIDLNYTRDTTSGQEGLGLLSDIVAIDSTLPVIVIDRMGQCELWQPGDAPRRGFHSETVGERTADCHSASAG
jgi:CheY-like chemotaxis protein